MKPIASIIVLLMATSLFAQQKETFDLVTYSPPNGWKKEVTENTISYTNINKSSWCRIGIIKSTISKGSIEQDFESEWEELIVKNYKPTGARQLNEVQEDDGWSVKDGGTPFTFNNTEAMALLTTMSGFDRCVSIVATTNSQDYLKDIQAFIASVDLIKPEIIPTETPTETPNGNNDINSIIGTWGKTGSVNPSYNDAYATSIAGYSTDQYTFYSNGTYYFVSKTFGMSFAKILLVKENGTYQISENNITITPQQSVLETWSKKDSIDNLGRPAGGDKWGKLLSSQKRTVERVTYQFTKHYFSGIQLWNLVLQAEKTTQRDGPHSNNNTFSNAWYYSPISSSNPVIELPYGEQIKTNANSSIIGTWGVSLVVPYRSGTEGTAGSTIKQYTFNFNGTYTFYSKTFRYRYENLILIKENGTYQINGNTLTINPQQSVIESWSKKDGTDMWGNLLSTQDRTLEKITYQFTKDYSSGVQEWNLVLQADKVTQRDGPFSSSTTFSNAWYYAPISSRNPIIELPTGEQIPAEVIKKEPVQQTVTNNNTPILGTWVHSETDNSNYRVQNGVISYITRQYTFNANGTYLFYTKTYDPLLDKTLLGMENGTYQISENNIIVNPQKSVLEAWTKIDNRDEWGKKLNTQSIPLEKTTYQFTKNYSEIMKRWELVLQTSKETKRDGYFSSNKTFSNAYYYATVAFNNKAIELPN